MSAPKALLGCLQARRSFCFELGRQAVLGALAAAGIERLAHAATDGRPGGVPSRRRDPEVSFRFHAGSTLLARAGVGRLGDICVGTSDGYLHSLGANGAYRWSYTLGEPILHAPIVAPSGVHFAATAGNTVHALWPSGRYFWRFHALMGIASSLVLGANETLYFVGGDRFLYALSRQARLIGRVPVGELTAGPVVDPKGGVWVANRRGQGILVRGLQVSRLELPAPARRGPTFGEGLSAWLSGDEMVVFKGTGGVCFRRSGISEIAGPEAALSADGDALWLDETGKVCALREGFGASGGAPALDAAQNILVPLRNGELGVIGTTAAYRVRVATSALFQPIWSPQAERVVVSASEGIVAGVLTALNVPPRSG